MTALWVSLAVVVALLLLAWRIHHATRVLDQIMSEELDPAGGADRADTDRDERPAEHRNHRP